MKSCGVPNCPRRYHSKHVCRKAAGLEVQPRPFGLRRHRPVSDAWKYRKTCLLKARFKQPCISCRVAS